MLEFCYISFKEYPWLVIYHGYYSFVFSPIVPAFSDGLQKTEGTFYSRHNNMLSSEVATELFRINDINCQFLLEKKEDNAYEYYVVTFDRNLSRT